MSNISLISIIQTIDNKLCEYNPIALDNESEQAFNTLFDLTSKFKKDDNESICYYISKLREPFEVLYNEFTDSELSEEEKIDYIHYYTPHKREWFRILIYEETVDNVTYRILYVNKKKVIYTKSDEKNHWNYNFKDFLNWMIEETEKVLDMVKQNTYYEYINNKLPNYMRIGEISRKDYDELYPTSYNYIHKNLSEEEINRFCSLTDKINEDNKIHHITPSNYYDICKLCYESLGFNDNISSKDQYIKYGKFLFSQEKLLNLDNNDYLGFNKLLIESEPYKFMYLINELPLVLYPYIKDDYAIIDIRNCYNYDYIPTIVKIYNALNKANIPVRLYDYTYIKEVLEQTDYVDIIPNFNPFSIGLRAYGCNNDFIYFPKRNIKKLVEKTIWKPVEKLGLI